jgi:GH15 family glucan-1,4-alpha-glucosidase
LDFNPIENYAIIGNMRTAALVSVTGSIDFFCFPRFDSPTVFAALLDPEKGGFFCIRPELDGHQTKQLYLPDTNVLITRFLSNSGIAEMTDFMPVGEGTQRSHVVRQVKVIRGEVAFTLECHPRFNYGRAAHKIERSGNTIIFTPEDDSHQPMALHGTVELSVKEDGIVAPFILKTGETAVFAFGEDSERARQPVDINFVEEKFQATIKFWQSWIAKSTYAGRWREMVNRSALVLKLLIDQENGSLVAAPTFGLPESIGGARNWDYRYTWLRDSSFSLYAMMRLGFTAEVRQFQNWIGKRVRFDSDSGPLAVLYRIDGSDNLEEQELPHLRGYMDSKPVRIGNAAAGQLQLDIYGELMDAIYLASKYGDSLSIDEWNATKRILGWLSKNWDKPDEGIWEVRGGRRHFLHSRLMCWVAFDRAVRLAEKRSLAGPVDWMVEVRDAIAADIQSNFWDPERNAFVQYKGGKSLDAAVLLMPLMRFISPSDPKWLATLDAIQKELAVDTLVYRYRNNDKLDGIDGEEGSFTACSFWYIEALARSNRVEEARILFEKMLGYANHVGLYAEELSFSGHHLGNFPQALTHLALISAATYLNKALSAKNETPWH